MKKIFIRILIILLPIVGFGQDIEKLKKDFKHAQISNDTSCFNLANKIINYYTYLNPDSAINYANITINYAKNRKNKVQEAKFTCLLSDVYVVKKENYAAIDNYFKTLQLISKSSKSIFYANIQIKLAKTLYDVDFNVVFVKNYLLEARKLLADYSDTVGYIKSLFVLSDFFAQENNFDSAFIFINNALTISNQLNNNELKAEVYYYYSNIYILSKEYLKATTYLKKSVSLTQGSNQNAKYLDYLADIYVEMKFYSAAENLYNSAYLYYLDQNNSVALIDILLDLATVSLLQNQNDIAVQYCQDALKISKNLNMLYHEQKAYYKLSLIYSDRKQIEQALYSYKKYSELRDSLFSAKKNNEAQLLYTNYITRLELQEQEILYNQKEFQILKNKQQKFIIIILSFFGLLLIAVIFIILRMYNLKKNNEQRLKLLTEATLEGLIIHDGDIILEVNDKYCEITGFERNEVVGKNLFNFYSKKSQEEIQQRMNMKRTSFYHLEVVKKSGKIINTEVLSKPMEYRGVNAKIVSIRDLSELSKVKEKLYATTQKFEALIETSPDGFVITDIDGVISYVSPAFVDIFGKSENEMMDHKLSDFVIKLYQKKIQLDIENIYNGNYCGITEYIAINNLDTKIYLECNGNTIKDINSNVVGIFMIVRDATERKLSEKALIESESRFKGLFNSSKDAIIIQNTELKIVDANPKTSELLKYSYEYLIVMNFRELLLDEDKEIDFDDYVNKTELLEIYVFTKNKRKIYVQISVSEVFYDNDKYYLLTIRDMTVFKRQEQNLRRIANKLRASNATKDKMFSIISHDLRGPIGNLKSMIEFIAENPKEFDMKELLEIISSLQESSSQTYELLENLLSWAKTQQNDLEFKPNVYDLADLLEFSINFSQEIAKSKNITISTSFPENISIVGDENMIKATVRNLISNAIKFSNNGDKVTVGYQANKEHVLLWIKDTGIGISEENLSKIFDDESYFSTFGTNREKGSGLGLKLCKEFVKKNNGEIWVESELDIGTTFFFTLQMPENTNVN